MTNSKIVFKLIVLSMFIALGVVISPILRVEGMCPMAHFINVVCAVFLGPWYALLCAIIIGILRMIFMGIPPLAITGAIFGAFLAGVFYRLSKGKLIFAVIGEVIGTGIIGAILSYPVMTVLWGKQGLSWLFYVPSFTCGTLIGGSIGFVFLRKIANNGTLIRFQQMLGSQSYEDHESLLSNTIMIASLGTLGFATIKILMGALQWTSSIWNMVSYGILIFFIVLALLYFVIQKIRGLKVC